MQKKPLILALLAGIALSGAAQATLLDRGGGLIYDTVLNITWLQDVNYAQTSGTDNQGAIDGQMNWANANAWAAGLSYFDSVRNVTYTDWRLPYASVSAGAGPINGLPPCVSPADHLFCLDNEMGYMFFLNLDESFESGDGVTLNNILSDDYWSGTELNSSAAFYLDFSSGYQSTVNKGLALSAWAVRPGDVLAVPEADTWAMLLAGLGLVGVAVRRRRG